MAYEAARLGDPIEHTDAMMGFLLGAAIGLAAGIAIVAATVATGGAALAVVAAVGTGMAATGGGALLGEALGSTFTTVTGAIIAPCSPNVHINGRPAARAISDLAACSKDGPAPIPIAQGSKIVVINGLPAARHGDLLSCGGKIAAGSSNVIIGAEPGTYLAISSEVPDWMNTAAKLLVGAGALLGLGAGALGAFLAEGLCGLVAFGGEAVGGLIGAHFGGEIGGAIGKSLGGERGEIIGEAAGSLLGGYAGASAAGRMTAGHPVDVATGELFTVNRDFFIPGPLPLIWSRFWISSSTINGALGHGWHHSYDMALSGQPQKGSFFVRLSDGRLALFAVPAPGNPAINAMERMLLHTDGDSRFWVTDYDGVSYEFGPTTAKGECPLIRVFDTYQNEIRLERNADGHLFAIVDSAGRLYSVTNDNAGRILSIDAPNPNRTSQQLCLVTYSYDAAGDLVAFTDARGASLQYAYDGHLITQERRRGGILFQFVWDDLTLGTKARCVDTWGDNGLFRAQLEYDPVQQTTRVTTGRGAVSFYRWSSVGLVVEETNPLGVITRRAYDGAGRLLSILGPDGAIASRFAYDELGRLVQSTNAAGETTQISYLSSDVRTASVLHNAAEIIDAAGARQRFIYDDRGGLIRHMDPTRVDRRFVRDQRGLLQQISDDEGLARRFQWSAAGDLQWEGLENGAHISYSHDALGRLASTRRGSDDTVRFERDPNGNIVAIYQPDGSTIQLAYDAEDRVVLHRDAVGRETRWRYDGLRFPVERILPDGSRFTYQYDSELNLTGLENPKGEHYQIDYDLAGQMVREVGFDGRTLEYRFDPAGRLLEQLDAGRSTKFVRDPVGRLLEKELADGVKQTFAWDKGGRLTLADNPARKVALTYDAAGRLIGETQDGQALSHVYDRRGRRVQTVLPDGRKLQIAYDGNNLYSRIAFDGLLLAELTRDAAGRETQRQAGPVRELRTYDPQGRLTEQRGLRGAGVTDLVFARDYRYDPSHALRQISDSRRGLKQYQYDECERLLAVDAANPESFVFDPAGNILSAQRHGSGQAQGDRLLAYDDRRFAYDEHGNRIAEESPRRKVAYRYGPDNELVEAIEPGQRVTRFSYDALGRRVSKESTGDGDFVARTEFLWNGDVLLAESTDKKDPLSTVYLYEPATFRPLAQAKRSANRGGQSVVFHYHLDHLGTPQEMSDARGEVVWAADLKAWGQVRIKFVEKIQNPLRFQGQYCDEETGLHYNRFRYYSPGEGRFINQDPIGLNGGFNSYQYARNPIAWIDPFGLIGCDSSEGDIRWSQSQKSWVDSEGNAVEHPTSLIGPQETQHILYGDSRGGGHMSGADITNPAAAGKSQFPASWSEADVAHGVSDVATDPASTVTQSTGPAGSLYTNSGAPSKFLVNGTSNGQNITVVTEPAGRGIVSGWPTN